MIASRRTLLALAAALLVAAVHAPARAQVTRSIPTVRGAYFDAGALKRDRIRGGLEALAFGRFTIGLAGSYSHAVDRDGYIYWNRPRGRYAIEVCCDHPESYSCMEAVSTPSRYRTWALDLSLRYYPSFLSFQDRPSRMWAYVGEFVGYHWRTWDEQVWYVPYPPNPYADYNYFAGPMRPIRRTLNAIQPGVEVGVRLVPFSRLLIDAGARFTLVTVDDPLQRMSKWNVESRLVVAGGIQF